MDADLIPRGDVDTRSIEDVVPNDLKGYTQCHFFAGLGGWAFALEIAGWPRGRRVWTGSCPCQPFSAAGKGAGFADGRHLWPAWQHLIAQCDPPVIFGEQVASKDAAPWIDLVHADMEGMGYAFGCVPFPSSGIGAPHIRDRNYWVADADCRQFEGLAIVRGDERNGAHAGWPKGSGGASSRGDVRGLANTYLDRQSARGLSVRSGRQDKAAPIESGDGAHGWANPLNGFWADADWLFCTDGKWRPVEPGTFPLAHGIPARVGRLRAYGNAIVPQAAAAFIGAYMQARGLIANQQAVAA
ncbi:DNA cytosine methyltransferase [Dyella mobilis]|uniref:DNA cytosine methyltransferase n=2 Tax=Dyella mobilis TaxID=1849582 RepID=A0ABS2KKG7_9GAMM|nr:DNA cytosine methyltransferase [Dyella mobilis]MBM7131579.1 DNA cytosine methyltransferase [Dyella mobilis]